MKSSIQETLRYDAWAYQKKPAVPTTLYGRVRAALRRAPQAEALRFRKRRIRNGDLLAEIEAWRLRLRHLGLGRGDVVTFLLPNLPHFPILFYAANAEGIIVHPLHPLTVTRELERNLAATGSRTIFLFAPLAAKHRVLLTKPPYRAILCEAKDYLTGIESFMMRFKRSPQLKDALYYARIPASSDGSQPAAPQTALRETGHTGEMEDGGLFSPEETAVYLSSGGTTGRSKIIELSSVNFNALAEQGPAMIGCADIRGLKMAAMLPFFHGFGLCMQLHTMLVNGMCSVLIPKFSAETFIASLRQDRPEVLCAVPTVYEALLGSERLADLSFLRAAFCGGDRLRPDLKRRVDRFLQERGADITLREGYGLTETVTVNAVNPPDDDRAGTVGRPLPGHAFALSEADENGVGELLVTGPTVMRAYLNDAAETRAVRFTDEAGRPWIRTGDLASFEDGYVKLHGRRKRLIKVSGISVFPAEIEAVLGQVPGVARIAVYPVPHPYKQQVVEAAVVPEEAVGGEKTDASEAWETLLRALTAAAEEGLMKHARPVRYRRFRELPTTPIGKVDVLALSEAAETVSEAVDMRR